MSEIVGREESGFWPGQLGRYVFNSKYWESNRFRSKVRGMNLLGSRVCESMDL